jgi:hypothetical protein
MKDTGGPAFPQQDDATGSEGMTLRDYFAAKVMPGLMGRNWSHHTGTDEELIAIWAVSAYGVADAMLKARQA